MDMDWKAALSSEIFREYLKAAVPTMQNKEAAIEPTLSVEEEAKALADFEKFQADIKSSPKKLAVFRSLREKIISDDDYRSRTKKAFVDAVLLLDLE